MLTILLEIHSGLGIILRHRGITICYRFSILLRWRHISSISSSNRNIMNAIDFIWIVNTLSLWSDSYHWSTKSLVISRLWATRRRLRIMHKIGLILWRSTSFVKWVDRRLLGLISYDWLWIFDLQSWMILIPTNINIHVSKKCTKTK